MQLQADPRAVCIVAVARTPCGSFRGALSALKAHELAAVAIREAVRRAGVRSEDVEEVLLGHALPAGCGQSPAKQAAVLAGLPSSVVCSTVNKVCASGMKGAAVMLAAQAIQLGSRDVMVVGGMESMSCAPHMSSAARKGTRMGNLVFSDALQTDGLVDAFDQVPMGDLAEACAVRYGITRQDQDRHAAESYRRAVAATRSGKFVSEIASVTAIAKGKARVISEDEEVAAREVSFASLSRLSTRFQPPDAHSATITAGNAAPISDGAAALVLMSRAKTVQLGLADRVLAVIRGFADAEQDARAFATSPALAVPRALQHADLAIFDVDFFEINEAFSVVAIANSKLLKLDAAKVNIYGGAVAIGHPLGSSGARVLVTLCSILRQEQGRIGVAAVCNGGGGASAMVLERESVTMKHSPM